MISNLKRKGYLVRITRSSILIIIFQLILVMIQIGRIAHTGKNVIEEIYIISWSITILTVILHSKFFDKFEIIYFSFGLFEKWRKYT